MILTSLGAAGLAGAGLSARSWNQPETSDVSGPGLGARAASKNLVYGAAARWTALQADASYRKALRHECGTITPEYEMKWGAVEKVQGAPDYSAADNLAAFAADNHVGLRGHTAIWGLNLPGWITQSMTKENARRLLEERVSSVVSRYAGKVAQWDVVNEAVEPKHGRADGLRKNTFLEAIGPEYIEMSFHIARRCDSQAALYYNDYGLEYASTGEEARRRAVLELLERLLAHGAPVDGLGVQSHLKVGNSFDARIFRSFLAQIAGMGLRIMLTEADVNDSRLSPDLDGRDDAVAKHMREFLDVAFDEAAVGGLVTWGITDRLSWLNDAPFARADGAQTRSLPLDGNCQRTKLWAAIAHAIDHAPARRYIPLNARHAAAFQAAPG